MSEPVLPPSTEQRVLRSTAASWAIQLARLGINFAARLVLLRLVLPEGHGVYELALRIVTVAAAVRDLGLPYQLVRDPRKPYGTVLAFVTASGALLTLALVFAAPWVGALAPHTPQLPAVLRVFAVWVLLDGLAVVPRAFFERELSIGSLVAPEIWRGLGVAVVSVALAWRGWGYWSFVAGDLVGAAVLAGWSWWKAWGKVPLRLETALVPDLIRRSSLLFFIWIAVQLVTNVDAFVVEWFREATTVGLYTKAYWVVFLVAIVAYPRALFPTLVEYLPDRARFVELFRLSAIQLVGCQAVASWFIVCNAEKTIRVLFGPDLRWQAAAPILRALAFVPLSYYTSYVGGEMLKAEHRDREWLVIELLNLASLVGFGVLLTRRWGAPGMGAANFLLLGNLVMAWEVHRVFGGRRFWRLVGDLALLLLVPLPLFAAVVWLLPGESWPRFVASLFAAALAAALLAALHWRAFRAFFAGRHSAPAEGS
ncbi:MAG TPA: oligosaccharide flippase family protein [Thermoanaerobaculia bacterium]|jgi:PST family polysaccharide transporter|nr:oligosaccharide flippase family protein [Thermoanaerobaculia bacterium]